jgi:hypothetical protein
MELLEKRWDPMGEEAFKLVRLPFFFERDNSDVTKFTLECVQFSGF